MSAKARRALKPRLTIVFYDRDGGWYKVMRLRQCIIDFRDYDDAQRYVHEANHAAAYLARGQ